MQIDAADLLEDIDDFFENGGTLPTPEEIAAATAKVRSTWSVTVLHARHRQCPVRQLLRHASDMGTRVVCDPRRRR